MTIAGRVIQGSGLPAFGPSRRSLTQSEWQLSRAQGMCATALSGSVRDTMWWPRVVGRRDEPSGLRPVPIQAFASGPVRPFQQVRGHQEVLNSDVVVDLREIARFGLLGQFVVSCCRLSITLRLAQRIFQGWGWGVGEKSTD
jgi:hypothetical protein